jgi:hypothetical protein
LSADTTARSDAVVIDGAMPTPHTAWSERDRGHPLRKGKTKKMFAAGAGAMEAIAT